MKRLCVFLLACSSHPLSGAPGIGASTLSVDRVSATADGADVIRISLAVKDTSGKPFSGVAVQMQVSGSANTLSASSVTTDKNGNASMTLTSTKAESKIISASGKGASAAGAQAVGAQYLGAPVVVTFVAGPADFPSSAKVSPAIVRAGLGSATVQVLLADKNGNPCTGTSVSISSDGSDNVFSSTLPGTTDSNGAFSVSLTSSAEESQHLQVSAGAFSSTLLVQFVAAWTAASGSPTHATYVAVSGSTVATMGGVDDGFVSTDAGATWNNANRDGQFVTPDFLTPGPNDGFFAYDNQGLVHVLASPESQWELLVPQPSALVNWLRYDFTTHALYAAVISSIQYLPDGASTWQDSGTGGLVFAIDKDGNIAAGYNGVEIFAPSAFLPQAFPRPGYLSDIVIDDSVSPGVVYAEVYGAGVFSIPIDGSTNAWTDLSAGLPSDAAFADRMILVGTKLYVVASATPQGEPWAVYGLDTSSGSPSFTALTNNIDSIAPGAVARHFAATSDTGFVTTDAGLLAFALADDTPPVHVGSGLPSGNFALAIDETDAGEIIYGVAASSALEQLWSSSDAGAHWQNTTGTSNTGVLSRLSVGPESHHLFSSAFASANYAPVVSSDAGHTWQVIASGVVGLPFGPAFSSQSGAETLWYILGGAVYSGDESGVTALSVQPAATPSALVISPLNDAPFVATTQDVETYENGGWTAVGTMTGKISSLDVDKNTGDLFAVNASTSDLMAYRGSDWELVRSLAGVTTVRVDTQTTPPTLWVMLSNANNNALLTLPSDGSAPPTSAQGNLSNIIGWPNPPVFGNNGAFASAQDGVWFSVSRGQ